MSHTSASKVPDYSEHLVATPTIHAAIALGVCFAINIGIGRSWKKCLMSGRTPFLRRMYD